MRQTAVQEQRVLGAVRSYLKATYGVVLGLALTAFGAAMAFAARDAGEWLLFWFVGPIAISVLAGTGAALSTSQKRVLLRIGGLRGDLLRQSILWLDVMWFGLFLFTASIWIGLTALGVMPVAWASLGSLLSLFIGVACWWRAGGTQRFPWKSDFEKLVAH